MKLDRNITTPRRGKYALLKMRILGPMLESMPVKLALGVLRDVGVLDWGDSEDSDFFVIRLKDKYAAPALVAYADAARNDDPEYASEIDALANAARNHPRRQLPT